MLEALKFVRLDHRAKLPTRAHPTDAGLDLYSIETRTLRPNTFHPFQTGLSVEIPQGYEGQIRPRSGLAMTHGVTVLNAPGTIDASYRGEVKILLHNVGKEPVGIEEGQRIAQLVITRTALLDPEFAYELDETERGDGGFGSTGL